MAAAPAPAPTIVVCGDTSVGKTSVIEAISGISLPRGGNTCTRTPTEVRMAKTAPGSLWECQLRLRYEGQPEALFGDVITEKNNVAPAVLDAQKKLLLESDANGDPLHYSRNAVCVDIRGPNVSDLNIVDLPGLITVVEDEKDEHHIGLVEQIVLGYIERRSIIAMVISCKHDFESQAVQKLALGVDPHGDRTIGVLTKPDCIADENHEQYLHVLEGKKFPLPLGYCVIKSPSQTQLDEGMTSEQAMQLEEQFFKENEPWSAFNHGKLGREYLVNELGMILQRVA